MKFISTVNGKEKHELYSDNGGIVLHFSNIDIKNYGFAASISNNIVAVAWHNQAPMIINAELDGLKAITINPGTDFSEKYILG